LSRPFDEIEVFNNVAVRTGNRVSREGIRGRIGLCRSLTELSAKIRRLGDGCYYLAEGAWPADVPSINLSRPWQTLG
jgi:hypothetical protein